MAAQASSPKNWKPEVWHPTRKTLVRFVALGAGAVLDIWQATYLTLDAAAETHLMRLRPDSTSPAKLTAQFALRLSLGAGYHF